MTSLGKECGGKLRDNAVDAVVGTNREEPSLFRRGGEVSEVRRNEQGIPAATLVTPNRMRDRLGEAADWYKRSAAGPYPVKAPMDVANILLVTPGLNLPPLEAVVEHPVVGRDGRLRFRRGYDRGSATYFAPSKPLGRLDVGPHMDTVAVPMLDSLIRDFEFTDTTDRANWFALLLTPILRPVIDGPVPMCAIRGTKPGTGKTLLAKVVAQILLGHMPSPTTLTEDNDENDKRITALLNDAEEIIFFDNVPEGVAVRSSSLAAALTSEVWKGRIIRTSKEPRVVIRSTWVATGNGLTLSSELTRRSYLIELTSTVERPDQRDAGMFMFPDLIGEVERARAGYLSCALTMVDRWVRAGMPIVQGVPMLSSYESWSRVVGSVLSVNNVPGFLGNEERKREVAEDDTTLERQALLETLLGWCEANHRRDFTIAEFHQATRSPELYPEVARTVAPFLSWSKWEDAKAVSELGNALRPVIDAIYGGFRLVRAGKRTDRGGRIFRVVKV
jgi:putative DNA primase/helicase